MFARQRHSTTRIIGNTDNDDHHGVDNDSSSSATTTLGGIASHASSSVVSSSVLTVVTSTLVDGISNTISHWKILALGQCIAFSLAIAGATNEVLALECGISVPSTYNAFSYGLIAIFGGMLVCRDGNGNGNGNKNANMNTTNDANDGTAENNDREGDNASLLKERESLHDDNRGGGETMPMTTTQQQQQQQQQKQRKNHGSSILSSSTSREATTQNQNRRRHPFPHIITATKSSRFTTTLNGQNANAPWYYYLTVAFIEAQAYYLIFLAFRYTSFAFVYVSDALAIPSAMFFTKVFMKRRYKWVHLVGGIVCVCGIVVNTASDIRLEKNEKGSDGSIGGTSSSSSLDHVKGDICAVLGAVLLGLDDVLSEIIVSDYGGVNEMLLMKGLFGALISIVQLIMLERSSISALFGTDIDGSGSSSSSSSSCTLSWRMSLFTAHILTRSLDVAGEMKFLHISEAALLNLLLLTSDFYAVIFDVIMIGLKLTPLFFLAIFLILSGLVIYEAGPSPAAKQQQLARTPSAIEFHQRGTELDNMLDVGSSRPTEHAENLGADAGRELT
mmetsp:Transcript_2644/g.5920  ORF Transcript_2644/g.5920 Transcript_2644/m.5920 type:complete len:560 (+) Transcript_2644:277-1956(+)